jgi:hypothetical protein
MIRIVLVFLSLLICGVTYSGESKKVVPPLPGKTETTDDLKDMANGKYDVSITRPSTISMNISGNLNVKAGNNDNNGNGEASKWVEPLAIFTFLLVIVTGGLVLLGFRQEKSTRTIERAYVKMSHVSPPGLDIRESRWCTVIIEIQNYGNTPADICDVYLRFVVTGNTERLPNVLITAAGLTKMW